MESDESGEPYAPISSAPNRDGHEPLAIVGIGCRLPPAANSPEALWENMCRGVDAISDVPADRWNVDKFYDSNPRQPGKMYVRQAGFIAQPFKDFDSQFFRLSSREASRVDPQQRLLLEVAFEAFENAGQLLGGPSVRTGVFVGGLMLDHMLTSLGPDNQRLVAKHTCGGVSMTALSSRLAYAFDLHGPVLTVDTACSSSLVAAHYACQSVWSGECDAALIAGVNFLLSPSVMVFLCKAGLLAPDARCKAFDAKANGYARSEGAAAILIKPLARALADGNPIVALIRGSSSNHGGHIPGVPTVDSQTALIRAALRQANVAPADVQYVEAHGTGTSVGDAVEARALSAALSDGRSSVRPCLIGSIKSQLGHSEAAAGISGLIKAALALSHRQIPPNLHFHTPNPNIHFEDLKLRVCDRLHDWPRAATRLAGVNSFGFGGSNAHMILEGYDAAATMNRPRSARPANHRSQPAAPSSVPHLLPLSARSEGALRALAARYGILLGSRGDGGSSPRLVDVCYSAATRRTKHDRRLTVLTNSVDECKAALAAFAETGAHPLVHVGRARSEQAENRTVWVYTGMGPQWFAMGRELLECEPVFRTAIESADRVTKNVVGWSLLDEMQLDEDASRMTKTEVAQPANTAIQIALTDLLRSWGLEANTVVGHSVGELGAAYAAGALSLESAMELACHRGAVLSKLAGKGGMLAADISLEQAEALIRGREDRISVAAINSPESLTLAGDLPSLQELAGVLTEKDVFNKFLRVEVPYHSPLIDDEIMREFESRVAHIAPRPAAIGLYSTVFARHVEGSELGPNYWAQNMRATVRFAHTMGLLLKAGHDTFVEVGPHPVLEESIRQCAKSMQRDVTTVGTLKRKSPEAQMVRATVAKLFALGAEPDWETFFGEDAAPVALPNYPWDRQEHWAESDESIENRIGLIGHPLLGRPANSPTPQWESEVSHGRLSYLPDHRVGGEILLPGSAYLEAAVAAVQAAAGQGPCMLEEVKITSALISRGDPLRLQTSFVGATGKFEIHSRAEGNGGWKEHASGFAQALKGPDRPAPRSLSIEAIRTRLSVDPEPLYPRLLERGYEYGPAFRQVEEVWIGEGEMLAKVVQPDSLRGDRTSYFMHPATLDASLHSVLSLLPAPSITDKRLYVPVAIQKLTYHRPFEGNVWVHGRVLSRAPDNLAANLQVLDDAGSVLLEVEGLAVRAVAARHNWAEDLDRCAYRYAWRPLEGLPASTANDGVWIVVSKSPSTLVASLSHRKRAVLSLEPPVLGDKGPGSAWLDALQRIAWEHPRIAAVVFEASPGLDPQASIADCIALLALTRAMTRVAWASVPRLWILTRNGEAVLPGESSRAPGHGCLWGMARTIMCEQHAMRVTLVDADIETAAATIAQVLLSDLDEEEVALRETTTYVQRLNQESLRSLEVSASLSLLSGGCEVVREKSELGLTFRGEPWRSAGAGQIGIVVEYSALWSGASDAAKPDPSTAGAPLELTLALGVVESVGHSVSSFDAGMRVAALAIGNVRSRFIHAAEDTVALPHPGLSLEDAACALPVVGALRAVRTLAGVEPGNRVIVRLGHDGIGKACALLARADGAHVVAVAPHGANVNELAASTGLMVHSEQMSRDGNTLEGTLEVSDVIIDASADAELPAWIGRKLSHGGRLVVFGATSALNRVKLGGNTTVHRVDMPLFVERSPRAAHALLTQALSLLEEGRLRGLTPSVRSWTRREQSAGSSQDADGAGATCDPVLLDVRPAADSIHQPELRGPLLSGDGTYLITGGLSGLGLGMARWLVDRGVRHLLLLGRRAPSEEALGVMASLRARGVNVGVVSADVADYEQLATIFQRRPAGLPPIRGIVHAAAEFGFELTQNVTAARFEKIMQAKAVGAWNLHRLTEDHPVEVFLMFSSVAAAIGSPGAIAYASANAFLDSLATFRHGRGQAACSVALGVISDAATVVAHDDWRKVVTLQGYQGMSSDRAFSCIGYALERRFTRLILADLDWARLQQHTFGSARRRRYIDIVEAHRADGADQASRPRIDLSGTPEERHQRLVHSLSVLIAPILGTSVAALDTQLPLGRLGIDSLMSAQLRDEMERNLGIPLSLMTLVSGPSIAQLATRLLSQLEPASGEIEETSAALSPLAQAHPKPRAAAEFLNDAYIRSAVTTITIPAGENIVEEYL